MSEALRTLLAGLIDYAGLFQPAALEMTEAKRKYGDYRTGPHAWMLGRFIVPAARMDEVDPTWNCSILGTPPRRVDVCEIKVDRAADAAAMLVKIPEGASRFCCRAFLHPETVCGSAGGRRGRAKVRTGGLTPDAFPTAPELSRFLWRCAAARVAFKATAGLHHPLHSVQRCTYQPDSPTALMHGFVNVFLAAALLWHGGSEAAATATLEERSPWRVPLSDDLLRMTWREHRMSRHSNCRQARQELRDQLRLLFLRRTNSRFTTARVAMTSNDFPIQNLPYGVFRHDDADAPSNRGRHRRRLYSSTCGAARRLREAYSLHLPAETRVAVALRDVERPDGIDAPPLAPIAQRAYALRNY